MDAPPDPLLLMSVPYAQKQQRINSPRYYWDNAERLGHYVIVQRSISGSGCLRWEGVEHEVPPGHAFIAIVPEASVYYFPPGAGQPWEVSWVNFYGRLAVELCADLRRRFGPVLPLEEHTASGAGFAALVAMGEQRSAQDAQDVSLAVYRFLLEWSRELAAPERHDLDPVDLAVAICQARFREPIGIKELATQAGLSREHLSRLFAERQGVSPGRFLRGLRVRAAREMLEHGSPPLQEVALRCGFTSIRALNRALGE